MREHVIIDWIARCQNLIPSSIAHFSLTASPTDDSAWTVFRPTRFWRKSLGTRSSARHWGDSRNLCTQDKTIGHVYVSSACTPIDRHCRHRNLQIVQSPRQTIWLAANWSTTPWTIRSDTRWTWPSESRRNSATNKWANLAAAANTTNRWPTERLGTALLQWSDNAVGWSSAIPWSLWSAAPLAAPNRVSNGTAPGRTLRPPPSS